LTSMPSFLVDSVILFDHLAGLAQATSFLDQNRHRVAISVITRAEVLAGFDPSAGELPMKLLDFFPTLAIQRETADRAASLRRDHGLKLPEAFRAALALEYDLRLVTREIRHLRPDRFSFVLVPYEI